MDDRKWEDLPIDCLVNIFSRVGLKSLIDWVPFVCKSWHKATWSSQCWQSFITGVDSVPCPYFIRSQGSLKSLLKFVISRSQGTVNLVILFNPWSLTKEVLNCIGEGCPSLKRLAFHHCDYDCREILPNMICKWKDLESLRISTSSLLEKVIPQISIHCNKFISLSAINADISRTEAFGIATLLPNIKFLSLRLSRIEKSNLVAILKGFKELVYLDVSNCFGFEVDDEILNLAALLATFKSEGVTLYYDNPWEYCSPCYLDFDSASSSD